VHELGWEEIKEILDNALKIKPRRQMSVQFSGGEPTMSPYFFDAVAYARKIGYNSVQAATNGIEFAKSKEFCKKAFEAGMRYAYLQFDGIGNDANGHRQIGNLFDVKLRAIENMHEAGIEIVLVVTIVNNVNKRSGRHRRKVCDGEPQENRVCQLPAVSFTGAMKTLLRNAASASATRFRTWRGTSEPGRQSRADARLVPDFVRQHICRILGHGEGARVHVGFALLRLPPELRRGHGADDQQETKEWAPVPRFPRCRTAYERRHRHYRRGARQEFFQLHDGHGPLEELPPVPWGRRG